MTDQPNLNAALRNLLEDERRRATGADEERKGELRSLIADRESELSDANLIQVYQHHLAALPEEIRPQSQLEEYRLFPEWEGGRRRELASWKDELDKLESKVPNSRIIYNSVRERVLQVLEAIAEEVGLLPQTPMPVVENFSHVQFDTYEWMTFVELRSWGNIDKSKGSSIKPICFYDPRGDKTPVSSWADFLREVIEWLIKEELLTVDKYAIRVEMRNRYLIHSEPIHPSGRKFHNPNRLSNGLFLESHLSSKGTARICDPLLTKFGQDPAQFHVQLG